MPSRDGYGLSEGRSRCDKKTAKGNTTGNALSFHWRKAIDEVDKEERSSVLRIWQPDHRWVWTDRRSRPHHEDVTTYLSAKEDSLRAQRSGLVKSARAAGIVVTAPMSKSVTPTAFR
jgi:hypothetical protein